MMGSATWQPHDARVRFKVEHVGERRLVVTSLELVMTARAPIGSRVLDSFPLGDLLAAVREWIVNDGQPNGAATKAFLARGIDLAELPGHDDWMRNRARFVGMLASSADGPAPGRKRKRDDDYLRELASEYVRVAMKNPRNPRAELQELREQSEAGLASDLALARKEHWLAKPGRGERRQQHPGTRLIGEWELHGYPEWHPNRRVPTKKGRRR